MDGNAGGPVEGAVDVDAALALIEVAKDFDWTWQLTDVERLCARQEWTPFEVTRPGVVARTAVAVDRPEVRFTFFGSRIGMVTLNVTDSFEPEQDGVADFVAAAFAKLGERVTEVLGEPMRRDDGEYPALLWAVAPALFVHVSGLRGSVKLRCVSAEYQKFNDAMREAASQL